MRKLLLITFFLAFAGIAQAAVLNCSSCSNCNTQITAASSGDTVKLNTSITTVIGCVDLQGKDNITFDCGGNSITGDNNGTWNGIYCTTDPCGDNVVIQNCPSINNLTRGIYLQYTSINTTIRNVTIHNTSVGFTVLQGSNLTLTQLTAVNNTGSGITMTKLNSSSIYNISLVNNEQGIILSYSLWNTLYGLSIVNNSLIGMSIVGGNNSLYDINIQTIANSSGLWYSPSYTNISFYGLNNFSSTVTVDSIPVEAFDPVFRGCPDNQILNNNTYSYLSLAGCDNVTVRDTNIIDELYLYSSTNIGIINFNMSNNYYGLEAYSVENLTIFNGTINDNSYNGMDIYSCTSVNLTDLTFQRNHFSGLVISSTSNAVLQNLYFSDTIDSSGLAIWSDDVIVSNITSVNNSYCGIYASGSVGCNLDNLELSDNTECGLFLANSDNYTITYSNINSNTKGVVFYSGASYSTLTNSTISDNSMGLEFDRAGTIPVNNSIYNNYFNNTDNMISDDMLNTNFFNTSQQSSANILGESWLGGNFWANPSGTGFSENCTDTIAPFGICDSIFNMSNATTSAIDYLPLTYENSTPPALLSIQNTTSYTSVDIQVNTDVAANITIGWGNATDNLTTTTTNTTFAASHSTNLTGLTPFETYYYNITSCKSTGYCSLFGMYSFKTLQLPAGANYTLTVYVNDTSGNDLTSVNVTIFDSGVQQASALTNASGMWAFELPEDIIYEIKLTKTNYVGNVTYQNLTGNMQLDFTLQNQTGTLPQSSSYTNNETTDFALIPDLTNASNVTIATTEGSINFPNNENFSGADLDSYLNITDGAIALDSTNLPELNTTAVLTFNNVTCPTTSIYYTPNFTTSTYTIYTGGNDCVADGNCSIISCSGNTLVFNVTSFSSFAPGLTANLSIWDTTDNATVYVTKIDTFYANYTPQNTTGAYCEIMFNTTGTYTAPTNMTYTGPLYEYNNTFTDNGTHYFNILCTAPGYDTLNTTDSFLINASPDTTPPTIIINTPGNQSTFANGTTLILLNISTDENATCRYSGTYNFSFATGILFTVTGSMEHLRNLTTTAGTYDLYYKCNDSWNNFDNQEHHSFTINATPDNTAPTITGHYPNNETNLSYTTVWVVINITTNENATCRYSNSTFAYVNGTDFASTGGTSHTVNKTVAQNNTYNQYYICNDTSGNLNSVQHHAFGVDVAPPDSTPPVISSVANNSITNVSATITWTTNESSDSIVYYGTVSDTYTVNSSSATLSTSHSRTLTGLLPTTTYFYKVGSADFLGNAANSSEYNFSTIDMSSPIITSVASGGVTGSAASVAWDTNEASNSQVRYGTSSGSYSASESSASMVTIHNLSLSSLTGATTYYYVVVSNDSSGNSRTSPQSTFTTTDTTAPVISFTTPVNMTTTLGSVGSMTLTVTTNEAATCVADTYKLGSSTTTTDVVLTASNGNLSHTKAFTTTSESSNYNFYFTVRCIDQYGNYRSRTTYFAVDDSTAPTATFVDPTPDNGGYTNNGSVQIKLSTSETQASGYPTIAWNGATASTMSTSGSYYINTKTVTEGQQNYTVTVRDTYSNSGTYSRSVWVDTTEPDIDETYPEDDDTINNCMGLDMNVTLDEPGNCTFKLYEILQDEFDDCEDECSNDHSDCMDDAEDNDEEDECDDDEDECLEDCEDDLYDKVDDGDMEIPEENEECSDDCEDTRDICEETCEDDEDSCMDDADDNDEEDECEEDREDCEDECVEDRDDCLDDCDENKLMLFYEADTCYDDADYQIRFKCEDAAGNEVEENITVTINDDTPPKILTRKPNKTIKKTSVDLEVTTDENAKCKFDTVDAEYASMNYTFEGTKKAHEYEWKNLQNQKYTFYVLCNDSRGNVMSSSKTIEFTVNSTSAPTVASHSWDEIKSGDSASFVINKKDIAVIGITVTVNSDVDDAEVDVKRIADTSNIKKPSDPVYQYLEIEKSGISNKQIDSVKIEMRVLKSWLTSNGLKENEIILQKYTTQWEAVTTSMITEDSQYYYYECDTTGFSTFAIVGKKAASVASTDTTTTTTTAPDGTSGDTEPGDTEPDVEEPADVSEEGGSWWWIMLLCVLVVGGGAAGFFVYKSHRHPQQHPTPRLQPTQTAEAEHASSEQAQPTAVPFEEPISTGDELADYIKGCLDAGQGLDTIKGALIASGYSEEDANAKLNEMGLQDELGDYIRQCLEAGQSPEEIQAALMEGGFGPQDVQNKFIEMGLNKPDDSDIAKYIAQALEAGMGSDEIQEQLITAGYAPEEIEQYMQNAGLSQAGQEEEVLDYISSSLQYGMDKEQVQEQLVSQGFEPDYVHALVNHVIAQRPDALPKANIQESTDEKETIEPTQEPIKQETEPLIQEPVQEVQPVDSPVTAAMEKLDKPKTEPVEFHQQKYGQDEILDYIHEHSDKGIPRRIITQALVKAGHNKKDISKRYVEIDAVKKKLMRDLRAFVKAEKKAKKTKKSIRESLKAQGIDNKTIKKVL